MHRPAHHNESLFRSATDEWPTPQALFDQLHAEFGFTLDPCATVENHKCRAYFTKADDGLARPWRSRGVRRSRVFLNPPYGRAIGRWMQKAYNETLAGNAELVVCLVPARTDAAWWQDYAMKVWPHGIRLLRGRVKFEGAKYPAPFPSAIVIFRRSDFW